jgi:hypothetical protein
MRCRASVQGVGRDRWARVWGRLAPHGRRAQRSRPTSDRWQRSVLNPRKGPRASLRSAAGDDLHRSGGGKGRGGKGQVRIFDVPPSSCAPRAAACSRCHGLRTRRAELRRKPLRRTSTGCIVTVAISPSLHPAFQDSFSMRGRKRLPLVMGSLTCPNAKIRGPGSAFPVTVAGGLGGWR